MAVRWYLRYGLSYRDVEALLAERGVTVDHVTIYRWVQRFIPEFIEAARPCRLCNVRSISMARSIDVLLSVRRDLAAARRFFTRAPRAGTVLVEVSADRAPAYPRVPDELVLSALHAVGQYANNPIEADHGRLKARPGPMRRLNRTAQRGFSPPVMPRAEPWAAATTTSPPTSPRRHQLRVAFDELAVTI